LDAGKEALTAFTGLDFQPGENQAVDPPSSPFDDQRVDEDEERP
jgi:hypothetical protein